MKQNDSLKVSFDKTILIIGAGAAGLSASRQLVKLGFKTKILEARPRIGGRVHTFSAVTKTGETSIIDVGANIITGDIENPIHAFCKQKNINIQRLSDECPLFDCNGELFHPEIDMEVEEQFHKIIDNLPSYKEKLFTTGPKDQNLQLSLDSVKAKLLKNCIDESFLSGIRWHEANLEYCCGTSLTNSSLRCWDHSEEFEFCGSNYHIPEGYSKVMDSLIEDLNDLKDQNGDSIHEICLEHPVCDITYFKDKTVSVRCENGSDHFADAVLCTIPLGVLKEK